ARKRSAGARCMRARRGGMGDGMHAGRGFQVVWLLIAASLGGAGCRLTRWKQDTQKAESNQAAAQTGVPQRVGDTVAGSSALFDVDDDSGRPKANLVLRLDFFPAAQPGSATLPACYKAFPADFELGTVACADDPAAPQTARLTAGNVEQDCYTDPK